MVRDNTVSFERRRSERATRGVPVFIYGHASGQKPFHEESTTLEISARGGLLVLEEDVFVGQKLLLTNIRNHRDQPCSVVRFAGKTGQRIVAVEFPSSMPDFWGSDIRPPENLLDPSQWHAGVFGLPQSE
jgi:hypothetical protein